MPKVHSYRKQMASEEGMVRLAFELSGKVVPPGLDRIFETEGRLEAKGITFPRSIDLVGEGEITWFINDLPPESQAAVYKEATKIPAYALKHLRIIVEDRPEFAAGFFE